MKAELSSSLNEIKENLEQSHTGNILNQVLNSPKATGKAVSMSNTVILSLDNVITTPVKNQVSPSVSPQSSPRRKGKRCNEECETSRNSLKSRISTLEKEKQVIQQKLETAEKHQESLRSTINSKDGLISTQTHIIQEHLKTIDSQKKLIADHELKSQTHSEFASSFLDIMVSEESDTSDPEADKPDLFKQMHDKIKSLENQVSTCELKVLEEEKAKETLKKERDESISKTNSKLKEIKALKGQVLSMEEKVLEREKEMKRVEEKYGDMQSRTDSLSLENDKLRKSLSDADRINDELQKSLENSTDNADKDSLEKILESSKKKDEEITRLKETVDFTEKLENDLKVQLTHEMEKSKQAHGLLRKEQERRITFQEECASLSLQVAKERAKL